MAVVQVNENTLDFIFDESVNNYESQDAVFTINIDTNHKIYYYDENNNLIEIQTTIGAASMTFYTLGYEIIQNTFLIQSSDSDEYVGFAKYNVEQVVDENITIPKDKWCFARMVDDQPVLNVIKGFRIENFTYAEGQTLETINELVNPYIGTKTSFAKTYTLRVNGKTLNTINGKKIRNLIYNGTTYEIAQPTSSGYTLTMNVVDGDSQYLDSVAYTTNNGETYTDLSTIKVGTAITLNNVISIKFKDTWHGGGFFVPEPGSAVKIGSTRGGREYGFIVLDSGDTITIDLTQDTTIYVQGFVIMGGPN